MPYFRVLDDVHFPGRWYLGDIDDVAIVDNWAFVTPGVDPPKPRSVAVYKRGLPMDFTLTEAFSVPVVSARCKAALSM